MTVLIEELTREAAKRAYEAGATVILPTGSIEQHGAHLPVFTDTLVVSHVAREAARAATARLHVPGSPPPVLVAPTVHTGVSHHHLPFAGTMSLPATTYIDVVSDLVRCLAGHGVARILILNGHGGNEHPNGTVVQRLVHDEGVHVVLASASYWTLGREAMASLGTYDRFAHVPGHAGDFETSVVLALRPDLVDLGARREPLAALQGLAHSARPGNFARAGGTTDNASKADGAFGRQMLDAVIGAVADYLVEFHGVPGVSGSS
jgi:creatinine amidohydrolase